jgi:hypothetical protein
MSTKTILWKWTMLGALVAPLLGFSCLAGEQKENMQPTLQGIDLTSIPHDQASLGAAVLEFDRAFKIAPQHPAVLARKNQLNGINDQLAGIIESIDVAPGHLVKFYASDTGRMLVERRTPDQPSVLKGVSFDSFAHIHRTLRPAAAVPALLVEADLRAQDAALASAAPPELPQVPEAQDQASDVLVEKHVTDSCQHFKDHGNCPLGSSSDFPFCFCNNEGVARSNARASTHSAWLVETYAGSVSFRFKYNGSTVSTIAVGPGEHYGIQYVSGSGHGDTPSCPGCSAWSANCNFILHCRREHRGEIIAVEAADKYHFGGCTETDAESPWECI